MTSLGISKHIQIEKYIFIYKDFCPSRWLLPDVRHWKTDVRLKINEDVKHLSKAACKTRKKSLWHWTPVSAQAFHYWWKDETNYSFTLNALLHSWVKYFFPSHKANNFKTCSSKVGMPSVSRLTASLAPSTWGRQQGSLDTLFEGTREEYVWAERVRAVWGGARLCCLLPCAEYHRVLSVTTFNYKRKGVGSLAPGKGGRKLTKTYLTMLLPSLLRKILVGLFWKLCTW